MSEVETLDDTIAKRADREGLRFSGNIKIILLACLCLPTLLWLGNWQLQRAEQKQLLLASFVEEQQLPALDISQQLPSTLSNHRRVSVSGRFHNQLLWLLDNKIHRGRVGYEAIVAFETLAGEWLLVNRGWVAGERTRQRLPLIDPVSGQVTLFAGVHNPQNNVLLSNASESKSWPRVVLQLDQKHVAEAIGQHLGAYRLRLDETSQAVLQPNWSVVNVQPNKHRGYALQWFAMALAMVVWLLFSSTNASTLIVDRYRLISNYWFGKNNGRGSL